MKVGSMSHKVKVKIVQFGVNSNKATTGHKLQECLWIEWFLDLGDLGLRIGYMLFYQESEVQMTQRILMLIQHY